MSATTETEGGGAVPARGWSPVVIVLLGLSGMLDFIDRFVFSTANDAIKHDLHLSDATIGLLGGTAFALLYAVMIVPFALIADRGFAARMATGGIALWSIATASMGRANGVVSMAITRLGVGMGQAMFSPSSSALNGAYSALAHRNTAFGISYGISYVGYIVGLAGGGWGVEHLGWRETFAVVGLAGLPVAVLMLVFIREPHARHASAEAESWRALLGNRPFRDLCLFGVTGQVLSYGVTLWGVSFYMRSFGLTSAQAGLWFGFGTGVTAVLGVLLGGPLADRAGRRGGLAGVMRFAFWMSLLAQPFGVVQFTTHSLDLSLVMLVVGGMFTGVLAAPNYAIIPSIVPVHRRAAAAGLFALLANGVGIGLGPPLFGWISDLLTPHFGDQALRVSLIIASVLGFWPSFHMWQMQRHLRTHPPATE